MDGPGSGIMHNHVSEGGEGLDAGLDDLELSFEDTRERTGSGTKRKRSGSTSLPMLNADINGSSSSVLPFLDSEEGDCVLVRCRLEIISL